MSGMSADFAALIPDIKSIIPSDLPIIVGLLGTTITPWMQFYIQSAIVEKGIKPENLLHSKIDVVFGCTFMLIVSMFIVICCATTLHSAGITIHDAKGAALSLEPLAGKYASVLFGVGLFNASFFAAALLPLATSYYVCEGMGWESGVDKDYSEAPQFFNLFSGLIIIGAGTILFPNINLFNILIISQIINGVLIPVILFYIVKLCNDPDIMGEYTNSMWFNTLNYLIIFTMVFINLGMFYSEFINS